MPKEFKMADIGDIWDDDEDLARLIPPSQKGPRLCMDLYESNANMLMSELKNKLGKLTAVRASANVGGDYAFTVTAQIDLVKAALDAVRIKHKDISSRNQPPAA
jgi:hypothetical protein